MRLRSLLAPAGMVAAALAVATLLGLPAAVGVGQTVVVDNFMFSPGAVSVAQGSTVTWSFEEPGHTTTSDQGFWSSGDRALGTTFPNPMASAGKFPYHCAHHASMTGVVVVPLRATGTSSSGWTLRWSTSPVAPGRAFDVQYRRQGTTTWRAFRTDTTAASGLFNLSLSATYQLRARTTNTEADPHKDSGWSPILTRQLS